MYQTAFPVGRRRSKNAERTAEIFRQHFAQPNAAQPPFEQIAKAVKGECPGCGKTFKRLDKHRCKG